MLRVGIRVRPFLETECKHNDIPPITISNSQSSHCIEVNQEKSKSDLTPIVLNKKYYFHHIYSENTTNQKLFEDFYLHTLNKSSHDHKNVCLFNFGYTGSGKTFTMLNTDLKQPGIITHLFQWLKKTYTTSSIKICAYEIYQNLVYDLLTPPRQKIDLYSHNQQRDSIPLLENQAQKFCLPGLISKNLISNDDLTSILHNSIRHRRCGVSSCNNQSSRSHAIYQFTMTHNHRTQTYCVIDLAGSEKAHTSRYLHTNNPIEMQQNAAINNSLLCLKECIRNMGLKNRHIPFRRCKLTSILRNFFTNLSHICFLATLSPCQSSIRPSLNILEYADILARIRNTPKYALPKISQGVLPFKSRKSPTPTPHPRNISSAPENSKRRHNINVKLEKIKNNGLPSTNYSKINYDISYDISYSNINLSSVNNQMNLLPPIIGYGFTRRLNNHIHRLPEDKVKDYKTPLKKYLSRPQSECSPRPNSTFIEDFFRINKGIIHQELELSKLFFQNSSVKHNPEFIQRLKCLVTTKTNIIDTVILAINNKYNRDK